MKTPSTKDKLNSGTILLAFVAVMAGLAGTYAVRMAMGQTPPPQEAPPPAPPPPRLTIPLASRDIEAGMEITLDDIALYRMTQQEIEESIKAKSFMTNPEQIIGKVVLSSMKRGETFDTRNLLPAGKALGIADRLKPGLRAVTVLIKPTNALIGFAGSGQRVDVLFHYGQADDKHAHSGGANGTTNGFVPQHHDFNPPRKRDYWGHTVSGSGGNGLDLSEFQSATSTLIQDVEVLALGMQTTPTDLGSQLPEDAEYIKVTLAVSPRQAELLRVASGHGELSLTLRRPDDGQQLSLVAPVTLDDIIGVDKTIHKMDIYRGKQLTRVNFGTKTKIRQRVFANDDRQQQTPTPNDRLSRRNQLHPAQSNNPDNSDQRAEAPQARSHRVREFHK